MDAADDLRARKPMDVSWKPDAHYIRDMAADVQAKANGLGDEPYEATQKAWEELDAFLSGNKPAKLPESAPKIPFSEVTKRGPAMRRMEIAFDTLKATVGSADDLKKEQEKEKKSKKTKKKDDDEEKKGDEEEKEGKDDGEKSGEEKDKDGDDEKKEEKEDKDAKGADEYVPLEPDPKVVPFIALREGRLGALIGISQASDYDHLIDAIGDEEFRWDLRIPLRRNSDVFHVRDAIGERGCRVVLEPSLTLHPGTMRQRNLPAEFHQAGAKLVLVPRSDSVEGHEAWRRHVGQIVAAGLERQVALRAMTLEPAALLGLEGRVGSLEVGKDANLLFVEGDPFEPASRVRAVMLEGELVHGELER